MRHCGLPADQASTSSVVRRTAVLLFAMWIAITAMPVFPGEGLAAPPELSETESRPRPAELVKDATRTLDTASAIDQPADAREGGTRDQRPAPAEARLTNSSVRQRGIEAPVQLRQRAAEPDPLDGKPSAAKGGTEKPSDDSGERKADKRDEERQERGIRVWPMRADSYTFTQAFGCVPQIAHFYQPGAGCPASAPVIHHGVDLAAPEGTLFYAAASGWVTESGYDREVGVANTRIIIQHEDRNEDFATEYLHWIASFVDVGDYVEAGEAIGEVGSVGYSTGPHLHFSIIDLTTSGNLDPLRWLPEEAGSEGYRGRRPNERARMRLPEGTTAGVPEWHDPDPPPPPVREDVPESSDEGRSQRKRKRDREERRAAKNESAASTAENVPADDTSSVDDSTRANEDTSKKGKNTERSRKRERNKNGRDSANSADGEEGDTTSGEKDRKKAKDDNRGGRNAGKSKNDKQKDEVDQRHSGDGQKNKDKDKNNDKKVREKNRDENSRDNLEPGPPVEDGTEEPPPDESTDGDNDETNDEPGKGDGGKPDESPDQDGDSDPAAGGEDTGETGNDEAGQNSDAAETDDSGGDADSKRARIEARGEANNPEESAQEAVSPRAGGSAEGNGEQAKRRKDREPSS